VRDGLIAPPKNKRFPTERSGGAPRTSGQHSGAMR
jgi:hypothetical protein